jgi:hypothetical protein
LGLGFEQGLTIGLTQVPDLVHVGGRLGSSPPKTMVKLGVAKKPAVQTHRLGRPTLKIVIRLVRHAIHPGIVASSLFGVLVA